MRSCRRFCWVFLVFCLLAPGVLEAQMPAPGTQPQTAMPSVIQVPPEAQPSPNFNAEAATNAYLAEIPSDARARSDAYFEGGYWMILWDFVYGAIVLLLLLNLGWSAAMRDLAERVTRFKPVHTLVYWTQYLLATSILGFPLTVYEDYFRERNAPSPLNGSMRSPKLPVTWPSTGHKLGAELARYQSAVVALRVMPRLIPTDAAPVNADVRRAPS